MSDLAFSLWIMLAVFGAGVGVGMAICEKNGEEH